jgi:predicted DNA-binding transcriptional regulator AlpA
MNEREVATRLGISLSTLQAWRWRHHGPAYVKVGVSVVYDAEDVGGYLACAKDEVEQFDGARILSAPEVAEMLGVSYNSLALWRCRRQGPAYCKIGGRVGYLQADIDTFLEIARRQPRQGEAVTTAFRDQLRRELEAA